MVLEGLDNSQACAGLFIKQQKCRLATCKFPKKIFRFSFFIWILKNTYYWLPLKLKQNSEQIWSKFETKIKRIWIWSEFEMYLKRIESQKAKWSKFVKWCVNLSKSKRILYNLSEFCIQFSKASFTEVQFGANPLLDNNSLL